MSLRNLNPHRHSEEIPPPQVYPRYPGLSFTDRVVSKSNLRWRRKKNRPRWFFFDLFLSGRNFGSKKKKTFAKEKRKKIGIGLPRKKICCNGVFENPAWLQVSIFFFELKIHEWRNQSCLWLRSNWPKWRQTTILYCSPSLPLDGFDQHF